MDQHIINSVLLSVISSPAAAGIVYRSGVTLQELMSVNRTAGSAVQEHLAKVYGDNPESVAEQIRSRCDEAGIKIITIWDESYPQLLREIHMPPLVLYCRGNLERGRHISIVGTRNSNPLSEEITRRIASAIASRKITVTSGLALGIDRNAHLGALSAGGGTVAVLPQGIDVISPRANRDVCEMILASPGSAVISELPPGVKSGDSWVFVRRNRIISGMSDSVIITQAPVKSGAMITARYALEQNRDLYVCPGNSFDESYGGCNNLIKQGAGIISSLDEFLHEIDPSYSAEHGNHAGAVENTQPEFTGKQCRAFEGIERVLIEAAAETWIDIDEISRQNGKGADEINMAVTSLEISGHIMRRGNKIRVL